MFNSTTTNEHDSPYLSWTKELSIGHELIDADHQAIFDTANRLQAEILEQADSEYSIVGEVLVDLIEHTGGHFAREEALMQTMQYPGYEEHRLQHKMMMNKVNNLHRQFMDGRSNLSVDVAEFMRNWLVPHILHADVELGQSIRAAK